MYSLPIGAISQISPYTLSSLNPPMTKEHPLSAVIAEAVCLYLGNGELKSFLRFHGVEGFEVLGCTGTIGDTGF